MTYRKPFSPSAYKKYDALAKEAMLKVLKEKGHEIVSSEEKKRIDIVSKKDGVLYYHEGEVKLIWSEDKWPGYENVRIPARKKGLVRQHTSNLYFYVFNKKANYYWFIKGEDLSDALLDVPKEKWNEENKEEFYVVPLEKATLMKV